MFTKLQKICIFLSLFVFSTVNAEAFSLSGDFSNLTTEGTLGSLIKNFPDSSGSQYQFIYTGNDSNGTEINPSDYVQYYSSPVPTVRKVSDYIPTDLNLQNTGYRYFSAAFKTQGLYSFSVTQSIGDPVSAIYTAKNSISAYTSLNPLTNLYAFNDDSGGVSSTGPWVIYYNQNSNNCTYVQFLLYEYGRDGSGMTGSFSINGPGEIASSCATLGPPLADTQASLSQSASVLRGVYSLQNVSMNNNLSNDCTLFDKHGLCASLSGTHNNMAGSAFEGTNGTLSVAYRVNNNLRVGAYLDQTLNVNEATGVHLNNGSPGFGGFGVWNQHVDGYGAQVRVAAGYDDKDMTVTRQVIESSEAGTGQTNLTSYGASIVASYAMWMPGDITFSPYAGIRHTKVKAGAYTETDVVTAPLTYSALTQNVTTALVGAKWTTRITNKAIAYAGLGVEQDLKNNGGTYSATGVDGLTSIAFNPDISLTRRTASIGSYYNLGERQRIGANLAWSEQAFTSIDATSLMVTYTAGF